MSDYDPVSWLGAMPGEVQMLILHHLASLSCWDLFSAAFVSTTFRRLACDSTLKLKEGLLALALEEVDKQNSDAALAVLDQSLRLFPFCSEIWKERGLCWKDKNQLLRSVRALFIAERLASTEDYKLMIAAQSHWIQDDCKEAYRLIDKACALNASNPKYFHFRAFIQSCLSPGESDPSSLEKEQADYKTVLLLHKERAYSRVPIVYNNVGYVEFISGRLDMAIACYNASISASSHHVRAYYNRSLVYQELGLFEKSMEDIDSVLRINPELLEVYSLRGCNLVSIGRYEEAASDYAKSLKKTFFVDYVVISYLSLCVCTGNFEKAIADSNALIANNRGAIRVHEAWVERRKQPSLIASEAAAMVQLNKILDSRVGVPSDELDDCEFTLTRMKDIRHALQVLLRMRATLLYLEGHFLQAKQDFTELQALKANRRNYLFVHNLFTSNYSPNYLKISKSAIAVVREVNRTYKSPQHNQFINQLKTVPRFRDFKFQNIEESIFFMCAFVYKYMALYLDRTSQSVALLDRFFGKLRELNTKSMPGQVILFPVAVLQLFRLFRSSNCVVTPAMALSSFTTKSRSNRVLTAELAAFMEAKITGLNNDAPSDDEVELDPQNDDLAVNGLNPPQVVPEEETAAGQRRASELVREVLEGHLNPPATATAQNGGAAAAAVLPQDEPEAELGYGMILDDVSEDNDLDYQDAIWGHHFEDDFDDEPFEDENVEDESAGDDDDNEYSEARRDFEGDD